jgi:hypothetical protein
VTLDALLVRPLVSRARFGASGVTTELLHSVATGTVRARVGSAGARATVRVYDRQARLVSQRQVVGVAGISLVPGGFALVASGS